MNRETLMDAMGRLPEDMLAEVAAKRVRRPVRWIPWSVAAACLCLLLTLPLAFGGGRKASNKADMEAPMEMAPGSEGMLQDQFYAGSSENAGDLKVPVEHFLAHVAEAWEGHLLVEPLEDEWEHSASKQIVVPIPNPQDPQAFAPGDLVRITYSGTLRESLPAQAVGVMGIERLG